MRRGSQRPSGVLSSQSHVSFGLVAAVPFDTVPLKEHYLLVQ